MYNGVNKPDSIRVQRCRLFETTLHVHVLVRETSRTQSVRNKNSVSETICTFCLKVEQVVLVYLSL